MAPQTESKFHEKGTLTPEEFVTAGDYLTINYPTWHWSPAGQAAADRDDHVISYLPVGKQYLVNEGVRSLQRANFAKTMGLNDGETFSGWSVFDDKHSAAATADDSVIEIEDEEEEDEEEEDEAASSSSSSVAAVSQAEKNVRNYTIYITYDNFHHTPRMWLIGYDSTSKPLTPEEIMEDINAEYANKVVTVDDHPFLKIKSANIHPCKHASVMKRLTEQASIEIDQYLTYFLKFMSVVLPTIGYDHTR